MAHPADEQRVLDVQSCVHFPSNPPRRRSRPIDGYRLRIVEKNYNGKQEDRLKTLSAERTVELHSSVAMLLRNHIGKRTSGWVFETKKHKPHSASNILKRYLHPILLGDETAPGVTGAKAGEHAFR